MFAKLFADFLLSLNPWVTSALIVVLGCLLGVTVGVVFISFCLAVAYYPLVCGPVVTFLVLGLITWAVKERIYGP